VTDRAALLRRYRELVLDELPVRARAGRWVVTNDHCFGRIVLDNTVGGCWYDVLDRRSDRSDPDASRRIEGRRSPSSTTRSSPPPSRWPSASRPRATRCCAS
jgi:hypothetical protein